MRPIPARDSTKLRVREAVALHLRTGAVSMIWIAEHLSMSVTALRRRLREEGTTYAAVADDVRRELADRYVEERTLEIREISFLLGFANATAFHRAFKRWHGMPPALYRTSQWSQRERAVDPPSAGC